MGLPRVDSVEVVKAPEPEKGRERVRSPRERGRRRGGARDRERALADSPVLPQDEVASAEPEEGPPAADEEQDRHPAHSPAYGPAADVRDEEPEHHQIDYRA